ncbi:hypothetical protein CERZMDRAFT_89617 [Cercospora zeae-maydis SCOH1-5]|uniref:Uncharacterized protein n=1 Tax=Cercospora zeae-maydis SCOH1-5 TaxID=717836 RepID=A0A6A6FWH2_9PEZI|nr:hypothetical protein CERZMDRAFT_89617 [Cercospora zeae-maydis SCOH1-5]
MRREDFEDGLRPGKSEARSHTKVEVRKNGQAQEKTLEERSRRNANKEKRELSERRYGGKN